MWKLWSRHDGVVMLWLEEAAHAGWLLQEVFFRLFLLFFSFT